MVSSDWRSRAGKLVLDPFDPAGHVIATPMDRRWLWRVEGFLGVHAVGEAARQLARDLGAYLRETCEHHWLDYAGDSEIAAHRQCLWCSRVEWTDEEAPGE
jgi:hypothetical protein